MDVLGSAALVQALGVASVGVNELDIDVLTHYISNLWHRNGTHTVGAIEHDLALVVGFLVAAAQIHEIEELVGEGCGRVAVLRHFEVQLRRRQQALVKVIHSEAIQALFDGSDELCTGATRVVSDNHML